MVQDGDTVSKADERFLRWDFPKESGLSGIPGNDEAVLIEFKEINQSLVYSLGEVTHQAL